MISRAVGCLIKRHCSKKGIAVTSQNHMDLMVELEERSRFLLNCEEVEERGPTRQWRPLLAAWRRLCATVTARQKKPGSFLCPHR